METELNRPDPQPALDWAEGSACDNESAKVMAAEIRYLQKVEHAAEQWIIASECAPEYASGTADNLTAIVKGGAR